MTKDEFEAKTALLEELRRNDPGDDADDLAIVMWTDQVKALTAELRPNLRRMGEAVRQYEAEVCVFAWAITHRASQMAFAGYDGEALMLMRAYGNIQSFYDLFVSPWPSREQTQTHIEDAGLTDEEPQTTGAVMRLCKPLFERGWAALQLMVEPYAFDGSMQAQMTRGLIDFAYSELVTGIVQEEMGVRDTRIPQPGDPNHDFVDHTPPPDSTPEDGWNALQELMGQHGIDIELQPMFDEDDEDDDDEQ
jgi:hypothetical protein